MSNQPADGSFVVPLTDEEIEAALDRAWDSDREPSPNDTKLVSSERIHQFVTEQLGDEQEKPGPLVFRSDGAEEFIPEADTLNGYDSNTHDNWALEFSVTGGTLDPITGVGNNPVGTSQTKRFDGDDGSAQTYFRLPVIRMTAQGKKKFNVARIFQEDLFCNNSATIVQLIPIT